MANGMCVRAPTYRSPSPSPCPTSTAYAPIHDHVFHNSLHLDVDRTTCDTTVPRARHAAMRRNNCMLPDRDSPDPESETRVPTPTTDRAGQRMRRE
eukprot:7376633-Prymnesium_polylepis.1